MRLMGTSIIVALALTACGSSGGGSPSASQAIQHAKSQSSDPLTTRATAATVAATTTTKVPATSSALDLARALGCVSPTLKAPTNSAPLFGLPKPTGSVSSRSGALKLKITTYTRDGMRQLLTPAMIQTVCTMAKGFGAVLPFYAVVGANFQVSITHEIGTAASPDDKANHQQIADRLGATVKRYDC